MNRSGAGGRFSDTIPIKRYIAGGRFGDTARRMRHKYYLVLDALRNPDYIPMADNKQLATTLIVNLCASGKVFLDVGSHIGLYPSILKAYDASTRVIGIEPMHDKVVHLRKTFPNAVFHECAAGAADSKGAFHIYPKRDGFSSLFDFLDPEKEPTQTVIVEIKRLDDLVGDEPVGAMKVIAEGGELDALKGAELLIADNRPYIMFESSPFENPAAGNTIEARWHFFHTIDYALYVPNRLAHTAPPLSLETFVDSHQYPFRTVHYMAVPRERQDEARQKARGVMGIAA